MMRKTALLALVLGGAVLSLNAAGSPFLKTSGVNIRNNFGQGDVVPLRGVDVGGWLVMEGWMTPMDSSGLTDNYSVLQTLNSRFGVTVQESLIKTYQGTWITTNDLNNIKALGMDCVRMPFWWGNVQRLDGTWRTDAFEKMDWLVTNAWQRGIYTVVDFHGVPGGQSTSDSTGQANLNQYWSSAADQNQTMLIWSNVAAHFSGNPAVAGYDLINEPYGAPGQTNIWYAYDSLYHAVRSADPDHIIFMEGCWSGTGTNGQSLNWQWDVLPPPAQFGWTNVAYSMHAYAGTSTPSGEQAETDKQVSDFKSHQSWNIPCFIGEFNSHGTQSAWKYSVQQYAQNNMSWNNWAYKAIAGSVGNSWGIYDPTGTWPSKPNIQTDSSGTISNDWSQWTTSAAFGVTPFLQQYLGAPVAVPDVYSNMGVSTVNATNGVLANDYDINLGLSSISLSAVLVAAPTNGVLSLNADGSFTYTPFAGFSGTDAFRYQTYDGYVTSANIATVTILTVANTNTAGPVTQLIWSVQPGLATNGFVFVQQPVLQTADASGNPSTNGLPASLAVVVTHSAGAGALAGTTNCDLGMAVGQGVVVFSDLQISGAGLSNQLTATVAAFPAISLLTNGNLNSPASTATPTAWTPWVYGGGYANHEIVAPANSLVGNYDGTYQMTCGAANTSGGGGFYQMLPASGGQVYTLTVSSGVQNWWWPSGEMRLFFFDANTNGLVTNVVSVTSGITGYDVGKPYQLYQLSAVAPADTVQAKVEFAGIGGGSVWFDNAVLTESNAVSTIASASTLPFTVYSTVDATKTNYIAGVAKNGDGTISLNFAGVSGGQYYLQASTNLVPPINWVTVSGSTNTAVNGSWNFTITNIGTQWFYRSVSIVP
jgi:aryl-phospho-beta-D-glucosidase BglC (GH1 family)